MREIRSVRDLETVFQNAATVLDGRETEQNWKARDTLCGDLRKICETDTPRDYSQQFANGIKSLLDGIVLCVISERTTLSNHACDLVSGVAKALGPALHPMLDILFPALIRLCAAARKISSKAGNSAVAEIIAHSRTYTPRLLHHISSACTDKNDAPRIYAAIWLDSLIRLFGHQIEQSGGLALLEKSLKLGLNDAHLEARENSRTTYWTFAKQWPHRAEEVMSTLDAPKQRALQDHSSNPNKASSKQPPPSGRSSSLAEMRAQAKKELKAKKEANGTDDAFIINLENSKQTHGLDKKKQSSKPRQDMHQPAPGSHPQRPLQPISNPTSMVTSNSTESARSATNAKSVSREIPKTQETASSASERSRPLMAAPVRRAVRVVSNTKPTGRPASREELLPPTDMTPVTRPISRNEGNYFKGSTPVSRPVSRDQPVSTRHAKAPNRTIPVETIVSVSPQPPAQPSRPLDVRTRHVTKHDGVDEARTRPIERENVQRLPQDRPPKEISRKGSPDLQAQLHLQNYIKKIRKLDLSVLGFGRVKRLVEIHGNTLFDSEKPFNELMLALFTAIENIGQKPPQDLKEQNEMYMLSRSQPNKGSTELTEDYRFAILGVIRAVLATNSVYFAPYNQRTIALLLSARGKIENEDHKVLTLEETAAAIVSNCDLAATLTTVLDNIANLDPDSVSPLSQSNTRMLIMGLNVLSDLFARARSQGIDREQIALQIQRAVQLANECLHTVNARIRQATVQLLVVLQDVMGEDRFEKAFGAEEGTMNMVAYYASRTKTVVAPAGELVA